MMTALVILTTAAVTETDAQNIKLFNDQFRWAYADYIFQDYTIHAERELTIWEITITTYKSRKVLYEREKMGYHFDAGEEKVLTFRYPDLSTMMYLDIYFTIVYKMDGQMYTAQYKSYKKEYVERLRPATYDEGRFYEYLGTDPQEPEEQQPDDLTTALGEKPTMHGSAQGQHPFPLLPLGNVKMKIIDGKKYLSK